MKTPIAASIALAAALFAGAVQAADPIIVNLTGNEGGTFSAGISHTINAAGTFEDIYLLNGYAGASTVHVNGTLSTMILNAGSSDIDISSVTLNGVSFSQMLIHYQGNNDGREVYALPVTAYEGPLTLVVRGSLTPGRNGSTVGTYSASFNVTPVPEPQTYALFAAGLAAVGFIARRRRAI